MSLAVFTFLISILLVVVNSLSVHEVNCETGKIDPWTTSDTPFLTSCQLYHVHITNNFTKIRILNSDEQNYTAVTLEHCKFHVFPLELFEQLSKLEHVNFASVDMKEIRDYSFANGTSLKKLDFSSNKLTTIEENTFHGASKLESLWLWHNNIKNISTKAFETLTNLRWFGLGQNQLETIEAELFAPLTNLKYLYLNENPIKSVAHRAFVKNKLLVKLHMSTNELEELDLEIETAMRDIHLDKNQLKKLTLTAKSSSAKLYHISAYSNNLTDVDIDPKLGIKKIDLAGNQIKSLEPFWGLSTLVFLTLDNNLLTDLTYINRLSSLVHLCLGHNTNITLTPGIFSSLTKLKFLKLKEINMTEFNFDWFGRRLERLQTLEIDDNQLKELDYTGLDRRFPALKEVRINENLFNCSFLEQMLSYWKNYTEIEVLDAYSDNSTLNVNQISCFEEVEEESSFVWNFLIVMVVVIIGALLVYFGCKLDWKLPTQLNIRNSVRNVRVVRNNNNGIVKLVSEENQ